MKNILLIMAAILFMQSQIFSQSKAGKTDTTKHATFNTCGMSQSLSAKEKMKTDITGNAGCSTVVAVTKHDPSKCPQCGEPRRLSSKEEMKAEVMKIYVCPMHPGEPLDKNGVCSKCKKVVEEVDLREV